MFRLLGISWKKLLPLRLPKRKFRCCCEVTYKNDSPNSTNYTVTLMMMMMME